MNLDIGCGDKKREGFTGMDNRLCAGVDIQHDIETLPWPVEPESCYAVNASHVLEHVKPWKIIDVFNELWRVTQPGGGVDIRVPYGLAYELDPTHTIKFHAATFWYFTPGKDLYEVYKPRPWKMILQEMNSEKMEIRAIMQKEAQ